MHVELACKASEGIIAPSLLHQDAWEYAMTIQAKLLWAGVAVLGAISFAIVALTRGEPVNAAWLLARHFPPFSPGPEWMLPSHLVDQLSSGPSG